MTTSPEQLERKVRQLDNDVQSIYELLTTIQATQMRAGNRLDGIDTRLDGIGTRLGDVDTRLDGIDTRLDGLDTRLDGLDTRLGGLESSMGEVLTILRAR